MATKGSKTSQDAGKSGEAENDTSGEKSVSKKSAPKQSPSNKTGSKKTAARSTAAKKSSAKPSASAGSKTKKKTSKKSKAGARTESSEAGPAPGRRSAAETAEAQAEAAHRASETAERARARYRRPRARRTDPLRDWSGWFRTGGDREAKAGSDSPSGANAREPREVTGDTVIDRGVDLGYRVVEEHIRQGQRTASKMNDRTYGPQDMGEDLWELGQRMVKDYTDFMALWMEFLTSSASSLGGGGFDLFGGGRRRKESRRGTTSGGSAGGAGTPVVAVVSAQPAWGEVSLDDGSAAGPLSASALHAASGNGAPLTDVTFQVAKGAAPPRFVVRVPEGQPPGLYDGVVRDDEDQLRGTLRVRVEAAAEGREGNG